MANRIGQQLGKYRLTRLLGRGSFAEVYLGEHIHLKTEAAVKVLRTQLADDDAQEFLRESQTIARLIHPNIVRILDYDVQDGTPFLVMDYAPNGTLRQRHPRGIAVPLPTIVQYVKQIADALQYAHDQRLIHRDVKPENMLIGRRNEILLSDFGTVQVAQSTHMESEQKIAGTVAYMSPEQLQGRARVTSDQYALAIVVYEWLTGDRPFHGAFTEMASQHLFSPPPPIREKIPSIAPGLEAVIQTALAKDYKQRFLSVQSFALALEQATSPSLSSPTIYAPPTNVLPTSSSAPTIVRQPSQSFPPISNSSLPAVMPVFTDPLAQVQQPLPPGSNPSLPGLGPSVDQQPPPRQQQSSSGTYPYQPIGTDPARLRQPEGNKKSGRYVLLAVLVAIIIASGSSIAYFVWPRPPKPPPPIGFGIGVKLDASSGEYYGLSDGSFAFDTGLDRPDSALKMLAAAALKNHDVVDGVTMLQDAITKDSSDAEARIYLEDQHVLASGHPYITLVVGTTFTPSLVSLGRSNLQGAYIAQKEYNQGIKLPGGVEIRLLIANYAGQPMFAASVANQIVQAARADSTIIGVIGWAYKEPTQAAASILSNAHIPIMVPVATDDSLTNFSPYFFRVIPSNKRQVFVAVRYAEQTLHATKVALFYDSTDPYSQELKKDFLQQFTADGKSIVATEDYRGDTKMFPTLVQNALSHNPNLIYLTGGSADASALIMNLPSFGPFAQLPILGGEHFYDNFSPSIYQSLNRIHFTAPVYPGEWDSTGLTAHKPAFFRECTQDFTNDQTIHPCDSILMDDKAMDSYDATLALLTGIKIALSMRKNITSNDLRQALTKIVGPNAIQGVTGAISFGPDGDATNKAVAVIKIDSNGNFVLDQMNGTLLLGS